MMLFLPYTAPMATSSGNYATSAAIKCLLAYTYGLEDCNIEVEVSDGEVMLTGQASCDAAVATAVEIAAELTWKPVHSAIEVISASPPVWLHTAGLTAKAKVSGL